MDSENGELGKLWRIFSSQMKQKLPKDSYILYPVRCLFCSL